VGRRFVAKEPPCQQSDFGEPARHRKIVDLTQIATVNTPIHRAAERTWTGSRRRTDRHGDPLRVKLDFFDREARWDKFGGWKRAHGYDSFAESSQANFPISYESDPVGRGDQQPRFWERRRKMKPISFPSDRDSYR
jgi:hypothetical protein